jgi:hypothetical protein
LKIGNEGKALITIKLALAACAMVVLSVGSVDAGPCNTRDKDAGR